MIKISNNLNKTSKDWFILAAVLVFIFVSILTIFGSSYIFTRFLNNIEASDVYNDSELQLNNQKEFFKKILITTNTNWWWYNTEWVERQDINRDDDDFNWESNDTDWAIDDDWDAFKYRIGITEPDKDTNILLLTPEYFGYANFNFNTLSWFILNSDKSWEYRIEILDWEIYSQDKILKLKNIYKWSFWPWDNIMNLDNKKILFNDILAIFIKNTSFGNLSYKLSWINKNWLIIKNFISSKNKAKNIDYYANVIVKNNNNYLLFDKYYLDILDWWKIPIAPTYLQWFWSWEYIEFNWDINDLVNTGSYYLFRWFDDNVDCREEYFLAKIEDWYKKNSFIWQYNIPWNFYYTICSSNSLWWIWFQDVGKISNHSNIINIVK